MKPDWKDAPTWANYLAMDADGVWCWFETEPQHREAGMVWVTLDNSQYRLIEKTDWKNTLQERPKNNI